MATDWLDDDALLAALTDGPPTGLAHLTAEEERLYNALGSGVAFSDSLSGGGAGDDGDDGIDDKQVVLAAAAAVARGGIRRAAFSLGDLQALSGPALTPPSSATAGAGGAFSRGPSRLAPVPEGVPPPAAAAPAAPFPPPPGYVPVPPPTSALGVGTVPLPAHLLGGVPGGAPLHPPPLQPQPRGAVAAVAAPVSAPGYYFLDPATGAYVSAPAAAVAGHFAAATTNGGGPAGPAAPGAAPPPPPPPDFAAYAAAAAAAGVRPSGSGDGGASSSSSGPPPAPPPPPPSRSGRRPPRGPSSRGGSDEGFAPPSRSGARPPGSRSGGMRRVQSAVELASGSGRRGFGRSSSAANLAAAAVDAGPSQPVAPGATLFELTTPEGRVYTAGRLPAAERAAKILRYRQKRHERNFSKRIKYVCRKTLADARPRVRGRFARNDDAAAITPEEAAAKKAAAAAAAQGKGKAPLAVVGGLDGLQPLPPPAG